MAVLTVDFSQTQGSIKPMNGVNNGPQTCNFHYDATDHFKAASIPFSRLHDTEYPFGSGEYVDIPCIFPHFDADETDPANYNFALTDLYLKAILEAGSKIIYRMGVSIEHQPIKRHIFPPKDMHKWARICEHLIRHVNEGWGNGYHMGIEYWEVWNEPDIPECWQGTAEQYHTLYIITAKHLKACFPSIKVGGPTISNPFNSAYIRAFLDAVWVKEKAPVDFLSWHIYGDDPTQFADAAQNIHCIKSEYGLDQAESILDEWNLVLGWDAVGESWQRMRTPQGAAFCAAVMARLQSTSCDIATYYDAQMVFASSWNALFTEVPPGRHGIGYSVKPTQCFDAFLAYAQLRKLGNAVPVQQDIPGLYALAAQKGKEGALLLVNYAKEACEPIPLTLKASLPIRKAQLSDAQGTLREEPLFTSSSFTLPPYSILLLSFCGE